jgi:surface polysaccharide O-acyltransferase-like enzyme
LYAAYHWLSGAALRWQAVVGRRTLGIYAMHSMAQVALVQLLGLKVVPVVFGVSVVASFLATLVIERIPVARTVLLDVRRGPQDTQDTPRPALLSVP